MKHSQQILLHGQIYFRITNSQNLGVSHNTDIHQHVCLSYTLYCSLYQVVHGDAVGWGTVL
jgi:hypothetical protein